jgi:diamine N-acetyltransferase
MIKLKKINAKNALEVMRLSKTLTKAQRKNVADNSVSIAQGSLSEHAYMRAVVLEDVSIGFVMLHIGSSMDDGIDVEGAFLWRLMIAKDYQRKGYGRMVLDQIVAYLDQQGYKSLTTSVEMGEESPYDFYKNYGFKENKERYGEEVGMIYTWK